MNYYWIIPTVVFVNSLYTMMYITFVWSAWERTLYKKKKRKLYVYMKLYIFEMAMCYEVCFLGDTHKNVIKNS
jgi:hypothetical protein